MAQGFDCFCGAETCRGNISGAKHMTAEQLKGIWLNAHIRALLEERDAAAQLAENGVQSANGTKYKASEGEKGVENIAKNAELMENEKPVENVADQKDAIEEALKLALQQAMKMVEAAQKALDTYKSIHGRSDSDDLGTTDCKGAVRQNGVGSRELSGEMGGDTVVVV
jgi:hypothetical protein